MQQVAKGEAKPVEVRAFDLPLVAPQGEGAFPSSAQWIQGLQQHTLPSHLCIYEHVHSLRKEQSRAIYCNIHRNNSASKEIAVLVAVNIAEAKIINRCNSFPSQDRRGLVMERMQNGKDH